MKTMRQDAWTTEDDSRLADIILRHIREGSTQLAAFEEASGTLGRTSAACGYRWNACVRKPYLSAIDLAKLERKERRDEQHREEDLNSEEIDSQASAVNWNTVMRFIRQYRHEFQTLQGRVKQLEKDSDAARLEVERLRKDKTELLHQLRHLSDEHVVISDDYRTLLGIVERARNRHLTDVDERRENDK